MTTVDDAPWHVARRAAGESATLGAGETVGIAEADHRVTAGSVHALVDLPGFDTSAMDGWAVAGDPPWIVSGESLAGVGRGAALAPGTATVIATGAPIPLGTTGILRSEHGSPTVGGLLTGSASTTDIRPAGEECRRGDLVIATGTRLTPALIGLMAAAGHDEVRVTRRPRIRLLLLGDELQDSGIPAEGMVRDSLGPQLPAWLHRAGADVVDVRRVADSLGDLVTALARTDDCDLVITTGGTAAGPRDHLHAAIAEAGGRISIDRVAVRPGHPMVLAVLADGSTPLVGLPGNPQAAVVGLLTLALPVIGGQLGLPVTPSSKVRLAESINAPAEQTRLVAGTIGPEGFTRSTHTGSAMLRGVAASTGFAVIPDGGADAGALVDWLTLP